MRAGAPTWLALAFAVYWSAIVCGQDLENLDAEIMSSSAFRILQQDIRLDVDVDVTVTWKTGGARAPPPRKSTKEPAGNTLPAKFAHYPEYSTVRFNCPMVPDPSVKSATVMMPDPTCGVPANNILRGEEAINFTETQQILSGDGVTVDLSVDNSTGGARRSLLANSAVFKIKGLSFKPKQAQKEIYTGEPIDLRTVVYLLDICDNLKNPFRSADDFAKKAFAGLPGSAGDNLATYYDTCSYGKASMKKENTVVIGPIPIDCTGVYMRGSLRYAYSSNACGAAEQIGWLETAEAFARTLVDSNELVRNVMAWTQRRRVVVVLPSNVRCPWAGTAMTGCTGSRCTSFINGRYANSMSIIMHEMQHNMGLGHATLGRNDYGDRTDMMGDATAANGNVLCHNAPWMYRIGWAKTLVGPNNWTPGRTDGDGSWGNMTAADFAGSGNWKRDVHIPASSVTDANMLRVALGWTDKNFRATFYPTFFISYRVKQVGQGKFDSGLPQNFDKQVFVHTYNGTIWERDYNRTAFTWSGPSGATWTSPWTAVQGGANGALKVIIKSVGPQEAVVDVCRMTALQEQGDELCNDGIDNDCNGVADC